MRKKLYRIRRQIASGHKRHIRRLRLLSHHPVAIPIGVFCFLILASGILWLWLASRGASLTPPQTDIVIISYDHQTRTVPSHEPTVGILLAKLQIAINPGDVVEPSLETPIHQDDFRINIYRASPVKIIDGDAATFSYSAAATPRSMVKQAGLTVYPEDALAARPVDNFLQERALANVVVIDRSVPVTLSINGFAASTRTRAKTVGQFLVEKSIKLEKNTTVSPAATAPITANETISVLRDGTRLQSVEQDLAMPVQYVDDNSLAYGTSALRQAGSAGKQVLTYQVTVQGGKVVKSVLVQTVMVSDPVTQIVARGTNLSGIKGDMALAGIASGDYQYADYIISHESGWCPTKAQGEHYCPVTPDNQYTPNGYGLCQATPGTKMASTGADWATNPITQLRWCAGYAAAHYGSWAAAYQHWITYHWW